MNAPKDNNRVPTIMVTSNSNGSDPMIVKVTVATNRVLVSDGTTGSGYAYSSANRDDNRIPVLWATSNVDGVTPVPIYGNNSNGSILIKTS